MIILVQLIHTNKMFSTITSTQNMPTKTNTKLIRCQWQKKIVSPWRLHLVFAMKCLVSYHCFSTNCDRDTWTVCVNDFSPSLSQLRSWLPVSCVSAWRPSQACEDWRSAWVSWVWFYLLAHGCWWVGGSWGLMGPKQPVHCPEPD